MAAVKALALRAEVELRIPARVDQLCCGTPWSSKGFVDGYAVVQRRTRRLLEAATEHGKLPVVIDATSCTEGLSRLLDNAGPEIAVVDAVTFVADHILPRLTVHTVLPSIALHPTCSSRRLQLDDVVRSVAAQIADETYVPTDWQCCAFAGDRGMLHPELTASATRDEARSISAQDCSAHASVNRTCEIGMTRATGRAYVHLIELVERATRPLPTSDRG